MKKVHPVFDEILDGIKGEKFKYICAGCGFKYTSPVHAKECCGVGYQRKGEK